MNNEFQALVTGALLMVGARMQGDSPFLVEVMPAYDDQGNYEPWFFVRGLESGTLCRVSVEVVDGRRICVWCVQPIPVDARVGYGPGGDEMHADCAEMAHK